MTDRTPISCVACGQTYIGHETERGEFVPIGVNECSNCHGTTFDEVTVTTLGMTSKPA